MSPAFDHWQFEKQHARPVGRYDSRDENVMGISFEDYRRMGQTEHHSATTSGRPVPAWTLSNEKVRAVILERLKQYVRHVGGIRRLDPGLTMWELAKLAEKQRDQQAARSAPSLDDYQRGLIEAHKRATQSGIAGLWARLIYERYRLGMRSNDISENMQGAISPWNVRVNLQRLNVIARRLFPEDCLPHSTDYGQKKEYRDGHHPNRKIDPARALEMRNAGASLKSIAAEFAVTPQCVNDSLRRQGWRKPVGGQLVRAGKHGRAFKIDYARALEMHEAGMPKEFIAAEFDVKPMSVHAALAKQGVTWRAGRPPGLRAIRSEEMKATIRKHLSRLRKLAARERNHGTLPSYSWLNANGFFRSYEVVSKAGLLKNFKRAYVR